MSQRIVVFCGPDMTGKTQIAKKFSSITGIPYFKASSEHTTYLNSKDRFVNQLRYADPRMTDFLGQTGYSAIFDRAWPCEFVYSSVFGRETDMKMLEEIDAAYAALGANIILTHRKSYEGIVDDIDPKINSEFLQKIDAKYSEFMKWTKCKKLRLQVDDENLSREINDIMIGIGGFD